MNASILCIGKSFAALVLLGLLGVSQVSADTGTLINNTDKPITYQAAYAGYPGEPAWQSFTLAPGQSHVWTVQDPQNHGLLLRWETRPGQKQVGPLFVKPNGFNSAFIFVGFVTIDASGGAKAPTAPPVETPPTFEPAIPPPGR